MAGELTTLSPCSLPRTAYKGQSAYLEQSKYRIAPLAVCINQAD